MTKICTFLFLLVSLTSFSQTIECSTIITTEIDKITGRQTKRTKSFPFEGSYSLVESSVSYHQIIDKGDTTLYMALQTIGSTLNLGKNGAIILLANGLKIERPNEKIDCTIILP